ncbi:unnamed protein product [Closterium sp. Yama58-4]|nr:unnamed protein product [Closterium sp. Yama58-4]
MSADEDDRGGKGSSNDLGVHLARDEEELPEQLKQRPRQSDGGEGGDAGEAGGAGGGEGEEESGGDSGDQSDSLHVHVHLIASCDVESVEESLDMLQSKVLWDEHYVPLTVLLDCHDPKYESAVMLATRRVQWRFGPYTVRSNAPTIETATARTAAAAGLRGGKGATAGAAAGAAGGGDGEESDWAVVFPRDKVKAAVFQRRRLLGCNDTAVGGTVPAALIKCDSDIGEREPAAGWFGFDKIGYGFNETGDGGERLWAPEEFSHGSGNALLEGDVVLGLGLNVDAGLGVGRRLLGKTAVVAKKGVAVLGKGAAVKGGQGQGKGKVAAAKGGSAAVAAGGVKPGGKAGNAAAAGAKAGAAAKAGSSKGKPASTGTKPAKTAAAAKSTGATSAATAATAVAAQGGSSEVAALTFLDAWRPKSALGIAFYLRDSARVSPFFYRFLVDSVEMLAGAAPPSDDGTDSVGDLYSSPPFSTLFGISILDPGTAPATSTQARPSPLSLESTFLIQALHQMLAGAAPPSDDGGDSVSDLYSSPPFSTLFGISILDPGTAPGAAPPSDDGSDSVSDLYSSPPFSTLFRINILDPGTAPGEPSILPTIPHTRPPHTRPGHRLVLYLRDSARVSPFFYRFLVDSVEMLTGAAPPSDDGTDSVGELYSSSPFSTLFGISILDPGTAAGGLVLWQTENLIFPSPPPLPTPKFSTNPPLRGTCTMHRLSTSSLGFDELGGEGDEGEEDWREGRHGSRLLMSAGGSGGDGFGGVGGGGEGGGGESGRRKAKWGFRLVAAAKAMDMRHGNRVLMSAGGSGGEGFGEVGGGGEGGRRKAKWGFRLVAAAKAMNMRHGNRVLMSAGGNGGEGFGEVGAGGEGGRRKAKWGFRLVAAAKAMKRAARRVATASGLRRTPNITVPFSMEYGGIGYKQLLLKRTRLVGSILKMGYNVLLADVDAVWLSDPFVHMGNKSVDIYGQLEPSGQLCGGFLFLRSTPRVVTLWDQVTGLYTRTFNRMAKEALYKKPEEMGAWLKQFEHLHEQRYLNQLLGKRRNKVQVRGLDVLKFPNGKEFFVQRAPQQAEVAPVVIHNNYIKGKKAKIQRFKEFGLWRADPSGTSCLCLSCPSQATTQKGALGRH